MPFEYRKVADGVHVVEAPQTFLGMQLGARMTVLETDGGLLVHSPVASTPQALLGLGTPRWVLAPNLLHHLHVGPYLEAGLESWAAPGLAAKRKDLRFHGSVTANAKPFGSDVWLLPLASFPLSNEVVLLHRPSRTLVVTDLVFNLPRSAPLATRAAMWCLCGYPGCRTTLLERVAMQRTVARLELETLADWDFDRLIMSHGSIIETNAKAALLGAFDWLLP